MTPTKPTPKFSNKFQLLAEAFYQEKTEKNFNLIYVELVNIARASCGLILKNNDTALSEVVSEIGMMIWQNDGSAIKEGKSFLSFVYLSCKNRALQQLRTKKRKKEIYASDMAHNGMDDITVFENMIHSVVGENADETNFDQAEFDDCSKLEYVISSLKEAYQGEEYEVLHKAIVLGVSPEQIAIEHDIASRITVSTRAVRARSKIKAKYMAETDMERLLDNTTDDVNVSMKDDEGCLVKFSRKNGKLHGNCVTFHKNGVMKTKGSYENGVKIGEWVEYNSDSEMIMKVNESHHKNAFVKYDSFGLVEAIGFRGKC